MAGQVEISGLKELEKCLLQLPDALHQKVLNAAIREGAKEIQREARAKVPKSAKSHQVGKKGRKSYIAQVNPGHLRKNIKVRLVRASEKGQATGYVYVSFSAYYGKFVEYGTRKMSAKPFMRPAFDGRWQDASRRIGESLGEKINNAAKNLAGGMGVKDKGILK